MFLEKHLGFASAADASGRRREGIERKLPVATIAISLTLREPADKLNVSPSR